MHQLIMWNLMSLDGYFEGREKWSLDWHEQVWGDELEQLSIEQGNAADMLIFGRVTYEGMAAHWQTAEGTIADFMNALPKIVCSQSLETVDWHNSRLIRDQAVNSIAKLKREGTGNLFVFGSANLSQSLLQAGLFDEIRICLVPLVLGGGQPLFPAGLGRHWFDLIETRPLSNGCTILRYRPKPQ